MIRIHFYLRMEKNMKKAQYKISLPIQLEGILFSLGVKYLFHACGPKSDGSFMKCHWSEQAVFALSLAIIFLGIIGLFIKSLDVVRGLALSLIPIGILILLIPNVLIGVCGMADMRCHTVFIPGSAVSGVIISVTGLLLFLIGGKAKNHSTNE